MRIRASLLLPLSALLLAGPLTGQQRGQMTPEERARRQAEAEQKLAEDMRTPRPIAALESPWIDELTWMEVRDALRAGKTTAIIPTGGIEQNGPYVATGKHNYVLRSACPMLAEALGNALCAPIVPFVPEGGWSPKTGHMRYPGTIGVSEQTFEAVLHDIATSLKVNGFENIVFIGDSGGNQRGMAAVAHRLNEEWSDARAHYVAEYYDYPAAGEYMENELGYNETMNEGLHDDLFITAMMMVTDPTVVRYDQRVAAGKATINGASITPKEEIRELGRKLLRFRIDAALAGLRKSMGG